MHAVDMKGQTVGFWFIKERVVGTTKGAKWVCVCTQCGAESVLQGNNIRKGTRVGGCLTCRGLARRNGASKHPEEYAVWGGIKTRALNPNRETGEKYRQRGIAEEWVASFDAFFAHVGPRPSAEYTLERIDNNVGYYPGNVRWATRQEQARNTSRNLFVEVSGKSMCLLDAAKILPVPYNTLRDWVHAGTFKEKIEALLS